MTTVECETVDAVLGRVFRGLSDGPDQLTVILHAPGPDDGSPWMTVTRDQYPAGQWPPKPGDRVTVTIPRVIAVSKD